MLKIILLNMKKNKKYKTKIKNRAYILLFLLIGGITYLIYADFGIKKLIAVKKEKNNFQSQIQSLLNQQISIQNEINKLKTDTLYIEQLAREKFLMVKPGEKVFKVMDLKNIN